ncbi:MAG: hypothetical protein M1327_06460 [Candidatus Thermoplasmatota archaeon]|nr:hypothetical protein [Candidatus Thermoplasmatota archaeon]
MSSVLITPGDLHGRVTAPGSKSFTQRAVLLSAFSSTPLKLRNVAFCDDDLISADIAMKCGLSVTSGEGTFKIHGEFAHPKKIFAGESGTSYRLVIGLLAGKRSLVDVEVSNQLSKRPVLPLLNALSERGLSFSLNDLVLHLDGSNVTKGAVRIDPSQSSQFVSASILFQSMMEDGGIVQVQGNKVSWGYVNLTKYILSSFGPTVSEASSGFMVSGEFYHKPLDLTVDGDFSSASFIFAAGMLSSHDGITIHGLRSDSFQPDSSILDILGFRGASASDSSYFVSSKDPGPITVDANLTPDLAPPLAVLGMFSESGCRILNPTRLRGKESDRYADIIRLAHSFGSRVYDSNAYVLIRKAEFPIYPASLDFTEHRMIMAGIIAGIASGRPVKHSNVEKISKSYPSFLSDLKKLGAGVDFI